MHSLASVLFGAALVGSVYGLSFLPSASLAENDDAEESSTRIGQDDINAEIGKRQSSVLPDLTGRD